MLYKYVANPASNAANDFLVKDGEKSDDDGDLFVEASFYTDSSYQTGLPIYSPLPQSKAQIPKPQASQAQSKQAQSQSCKVKEVLNIMLQDEETKTALTAFMVSFQAYQGSHLNQMDIVLHDLFEMDPDDVEEMDLKWQMVMVACRTQKHAYVNKKYKLNINKTVGFDKSKSRRFNCNSYGHFSRECKALRNPNAFGQSTSGQSSSNNQAFQQQPSYQQRTQRIFQKPYQSLPMPELKETGKSSEEGKALMVSIKDGFGWSPYADHFNAEFTSNLALLADFEDENEEETPEESD